ncbi:MAG TPA: DoxX family protein [Blastocatellia bacterium]|nr:DoxX family protein [Blastocatellia bacterium]
MEALRVCSDLIGKKDWRIREVFLQRQFSAFPGDWEGVALLALRVLVGLTLVVQCVLYVGSPIVTWARWLAPAISFATGACLLAGFMTSIAAIIAGIGSIGFALHWVSGPVENPLDSHFAALSLIVVAGAVAVLGPGAFSLDARIFGRREIRVPRQPKS